MARTESFYEGDYLPTQWKFLTMSEYLTAFVGGLGSGKTHIFLRKVYKQHITRDPKKTNKKGRTHGLILYPTFGLAEELFIGPFMELLESRRIKFKYDRQYHRFATLYGSINIYQLTTPQRIVGSSYTFAGLDEFDVGSWKNCHMAFTKTTGRMRGCSHPEIFFVTSPEGTHYTYKIFVTDNKNRDRAILHARSTDNIHLPDNYVSNMEKTYDERMIRAYRDGEFVNLTQGQVYYAFGDHNIRKVDIDPYLPLVIACDFNRGEKPMCWNVGQIHGNAVHIKAALSVKHTNTSDMCLYLEDHIRKNIRQELGELKFYGDYSGHTETSNSQRSDWDIITQHFTNITTRLRVHTEPCKSVRDQVTVTNGMLKSAKGDVRIFIDPEAEALIQDLRMTVWGESGMREDQTNPERSHSSSALRYLCNKEFAYRRLRGAE
jgi:hypothetical protein